MLGRPTNLPIFWGFVVSVLLHVLGLTLLTYENNDGLIPAEEAEPMPFPLDKERRIELGDPESDAISMSWIGFEDYKKHVATPSEVDQPELTMDPAPASRAMMGQQAAAAAQAMQAASEAVERMRQEMGGAVNAMAQAMEPWAMLADLSRRTDERAEKRESKEQEEAEDLAEAEKTKESEKKPTEVAEQTQGEPSPQQQPAPQVTPVVSSADSDSQGEQDNRESDASSIDRDDLGQPGRPIVARGLRIRTVKPKFSGYVRATVKPRNNPVIRIHFGGDGRPRRVELLEKSGMRDIDKPVLDAAYKWFAEGAAIDALDPNKREDTVSIEVRILL